MIHLIMTSLLYIISNTQGVRGFSAKLNGFVEVSAIEPSRRMHVKLNTFYFFFVVPSNGFVSRVIPASYSSDTVMTHALCCG